METRTFDLDPEWTVARVFPCGHVQHACCRAHLDETCPVCATCVTCHAPIKQDEGGTWIDDTGGDVCMDNDGIDGTHTPKENA